MVNPLSIRQKQTFSGQLGTIALGLLACLVWAFIAIWIWQFLYKPSPASILSLGGFKLHPFHLHDVDFNYVSVWGDITFILILCPLWEELAFRVIPIQIARVVPRNLTWPIVLMAGFIFGWYHGSLANIIMQGVLGVIMTWVYIRNGFSFMSSFLTHAFYNLIVVYFFPLLFVYPS